MLRPVHTLVVALATFMLGGPAMAGGLLPDRNNQILIEGHFAVQNPAFLLIFSAKPLTDERGRPVQSMTASQAAGFVNSEDQLAIRIYGKPLSRQGRFDVFFGTEADADMPWNDGRDFDWKDWEKYSPDIWDNLCVVPVPPPGTSGNTRAFAVINDVTIRRGGKVLFDSRARESYPNKRPVRASLKPFTAAVRNGRYPVLNLSANMESFRTQFYELGENPILNLAYSDLGQTEKRKYASRGSNWCSEFATYLYRQCNIMTPDPNRSDVHWRNMREYFEQNGKVYSARDVAGWTDAEKIKRIKPGSFVSIALGDTTHSLVFTTWVIERGQPVTRYTAISGNNRGMVWPHAPLKLPALEDFKAMTPEQLREYDQKVYFAVPQQSGG